MAEVTERRESGEGDSDATRGDSASRKFNVFLDEANTDSYTGVLDDRLNPIAPLALRYLRGSNHPQNQDIYLADYRKVRMLDMDATTSHWIVEVVYSTALGIPNTIMPGWVVEYDTPMQMEQVVRDLDGKWIGGHAYTFPIDEFTSPVVGILKTAKTVRGDIDVVQMPLEDAVKPHSLQRPVPGTTIRLSRTIENLTALQTTKAESYVGKCNSDRFLTGNPFEILQAGMRIRQRPGSGVGTVTTGIMYDVQLFFRKNLRGWKHQRIFDTFDTDGFRGSIMEDDPDPNNPGQIPISSQFRMVEAVPLNAMLGYLGNPGGRGGRLTSPRPGGRAGKP